MFSFLSMTHAQYDALSPKDPHTLYNVSDFKSGIYGVRWLGTADSSMARTDNAADFSDPTPAVNNGTGSSPFDNILPWAGMRIVDDNYGNTLVSIPKYYYKWTKTGQELSLQISDKPQPGFYTSPAHLRRSWADHDRDVVYVGRYHCNSSYKSVTNTWPIAALSISECRENIPSPANSYAYDIAMYWTIMMLYLVEYADWDSQKMIGFGCEALSSTGSTDGMQYHTGTSAINRTTYGAVQYRGIEGLWSGGRDWVNGLSFQGTDVYCNANYADISSSGTLIGQRPYAWGGIMNWDICTVPVYHDYAQILIPSEIQTGSSSGYTFDNTYICDDYCYDWVSGDTAQFLKVGGEGQTRGAGLFSWNTEYTDDNHDDFYGTCRLMVLPFHEELAYTYDD